MTSSIKMGKAGVCMETMHAIVKLKPETGIWMDPVPFPSIGHNDVLIKVVKTAICGTDIHIYNWDAWSRKTIPTPMTIGHEFVGLITEIGSDVRGLKKGDPCFKHSLNVNALIRVVLCIVYVLMR